MAFTHIAVGFLFYISFPREKACIQQVEFTAVVINCLMACRFVRNNPEIMMVNYCNSSFIS